MKEGMDVASFFNIASYRYLWKLLEVITLIMLVRIIGIEDFRTGIIVMVALFFLSCLLNFTHRYSETAKIREFYNAVRLIMPAVGLMVAIPMMVAGFLGAPQYYYGAAIVFLMSLLYPADHYYSLKNEEKLYKAYFIAQFFASILAISMAISGLGYHSILMGYVVFYLGSNIMLWIRFPFRVHFHIKKGVTHDMFFIWRNSFFDYLASAMYYYGVLILCFAFFPEYFVSLYVAYILGFFLYENITIFINSMLVEKFMKMTDELIKYNLVRLAEYYSFLILPSSGMLVLLSHEIMELGLGFGSYEALILLASAGMVKGIFEIARLALISRNMVDVIQKIRILELSVLTVALLFGFVYGAAALPAAVFIASLFTSMAYVIVIAKNFKLNLAASSRDYAYILISSLITLLILGFLKEFTAVRSIYSIGLLIFLATGIYLVTTYLFHKEFYKRFIKFVFSIIEDNV